MAKIAGLIKRDTANGPGIRCSIFVSGCEHHCKGCFNQVAWDFDFGEEFTKETIRTILLACKTNFIQGISILGGEPLHPRNEEMLLRLVKDFKYVFPKKNIWCWTGYLYEEVKDRSKLIPYIDVLIDGKFMEELKDTTLQYKGSSNQRVIDVKKSLETNDIILRN